MDQPVDEKRENRSCLAWFCYKTWYPFQTMRSVLTLSIVLGVIFIAVGCIQIGLYSSINEFEVIYANNQGCIQRKNGNHCESILEVTQDLTPPIAFVYFVQNAYINHRRYIDSVSADQLSGKTIDMQQAKKDCTPFVTNENMHENKSYTGVPLNPQFIASPCGFSSHMMFNDTFALTDQSGKKIAINQGGLSQNIYGQFKKAADSESTQWINPEDEHYMIWMKNSGLISKYKLWGRIEEPLPAGKYNLQVDNNFQIGTMSIKKGVRVVSLSKIGSPVYFYPIAFILMGLTCFGFAIFMWKKLPNYDELLKQLNAEKK